MTKFIKIRAKIMFDCDMLRIFENADNIRKMFYFALKLR